MNSTTPPWAGATPALPFFLVPEGRGSNLGREPSVNGALNASAVLRDPFRWKLDDDSAELTQPLGQTAKALALNSKAEAAFGCYVSSPSEVALAASSPAAFLYVPGEVCRQADVLEACRVAGRPVVLERGPFLPPSDMARALQKLAGLAVLLVDAGGVNGYADRVLDPRALWILKETGAPFGVHLGECIAPRGARYEWKPDWLANASFATPLTLTARALGASAYVLPDDEAVAAGIIALLGSKEAQ